MGGLTVVKYLIKQGLFSKIIYYADMARVPYGTKDPQTIKKYSLQALDFFSKYKDLEMLILACNTASVYGLDAVKKQSKFPVMGMIEAGLEAVKRSSIKKGDKILVIGTNATIGSNVYQDKLRSFGYTNVNAVATPLLVQTIEKWSLEPEKLQKIMNEYFKDTGKPDAIVLACTHFPLIGEKIKSFFGNTKLIDPAKTLTDLLKTELASKTFKKTQLELHSSGNLESLKKLPTFG